MTPILETIGQLPALAQVVTILTIGAICFPWIVKTYKKALKEAIEEPSKSPEKPHDMVLTAGSITDMGPFREMVIELRRIANSLEGMMGLANDKETDAEVRERAAQMDRDRQFTEILSRLHEVEVANRRPRRP